MRRTSFHLPEKCLFLSWWKECSRKDEVWAGENPEAVVQGIPKKMEDLEVTEKDKLFNKSISQCQQDQWTKPWVILPRVVCWTNLLKILSPDLACVAG